MSYRIAAVAMALTVLCALDANAETAAVRIQPHVRPMAQASIVNQGSGKNGAMHALPAPVINEMHALRQTDGSVVVDCREIKNPKAAISYLQNRRQPQKTPVETK